MDDKKWEEILQACEAAKRRCLLTNPNSSYIQGEERKLFDKIYSEAIRGRDWSIYNDETLQVLKEIHIDDNLLDAMAKDVLFEALDKWCQRNEIEKEKRIAVQEALIKMRAEMDLALQEQEKELRAEYSKREGVLIAALGKKKHTNHSKGLGGKGPRTEFMNEQMSEFERFLLDHNYHDDTDNLYALANQCWIEHETEWEKAKNAEGQKKGYSCSKCLADARRNKKAK